MKGGPLAGGGTSGEGVSYSIVVCTCSIAIHV